MKTGDRVDDRYEILEEIGRGGSSIVYGARDLVEGRHVAVKLLVPPPVAAEAALERLRREVRALKAVEHPNIVPVHALIEAEHRAYVVMARVFGSDLGARVKAEGPLSTDEVVAVGVQIGGALAAAHARSIVHRDVKPANVLVTSEGRAHLVDFGSARIEGDSSLTRTGGIAFTLDFAAPEAVAGERLDARADVYALGMTLFFAATGKLPAKLPMHLAPPPAEDGHSPRALSPSVPAWLDRIVRRATMADPRRRFPTAAMMTRALETAGVEDVGALCLAGSRFCFACGSAQVVSESAHPETSSEAGARVALTAEGLVGPTESFCRACLAVEGESRDTLIFLEPQSSGLAEEEAAVKLTALGGQRAVDPGLGEVVRGHRPIARVRARDAARVAARFAKEGLIVRAVPAELGYRALPAPFFAMLTSIVIVAGLAAVVSPLHPLFGGTLAFALYGAARKRLERPWAEPAMRTGSTSMGIPGHIAAEVDRTLGSLGEGRAQELLVDVVELSRDHFDADDTAEAVGQVVTTACEAAIALDRAERARRRLESSLGRLAKEGAGPLDRAHACIEETEAALTQRLLEAIAAVSLAGVGRAEQEARNLDDARRALTDELTVRRAAMAEVEATLRAG